MGFIEYCNFKDNPECDYLLVIPPFNDVGVVPLGAGYITSHLKNNGYSASVFDLNVKLHNLYKHPNFWKGDIPCEYDINNPYQLFLDYFGEEIKEFIEFVAKHPCRIVSFSARIDNYYLVEHLIKEIKALNADKVCVVGGIIFETDPHLIKDDSPVDAYIFGEGEAPFFKVIDHLRKGIPLKELIDAPGTCIVWDGKAYQNLKRDPVMRLDTIAFPTYEEFDLKDYFLNHDCPIIPLLLSRGCINHCTYCIDCMNNFPYRIRSPELIVEEMRYHLEKYNVSNFQFNDLLCNGNLKQLDRFADLLIESNLNITWYSYGIIRKGMTQELFEKLKRSGCSGLIFGVESGSNSVLSRMCKNSSAEVAYDLLKNVHAAGIDVSINIILGYPDETEEEFQETCKFIKDVKPFISHVAVLSTFYMMKSSRLYLSKVALEDDPSSDDSSIIHFNELPLDVKKDRMRRFLILMDELELFASNVNYPSGPVDSMKCLVDALKKHSKEENFSVSINNTWFVGSSKSMSYMYMTSDEKTARINFNLVFFSQGNICVSDTDAKIGVKNLGDELEITLVYKSIPVVGILRAKPENGGISLYGDFLCNEDFEFHEIMISFVLPEEFDSYLFDNASHPLPAFEESLNHHFSCILHEITHSIGGGHSFTITSKDPYFNVIDLMNTPAKDHGHIANIVAGRRQEARIFKKGERIPFSIFVKTTFNN